MNTSYAWLNNLQSFSDIMSQVLSSSEHNKQSNVSNARKNEEIYAIHATNIMPIAHKAGRSTSFLSKNQHQGCNKAKLSTYARI